MKAENNGNFSYNFNLYPSCQDVCEFYDFYCSFCKKKDIDPVSLIDIEKYLAIGALTLVSVSDLARGKLSYTCYIRDDKCVRAWFTCSNFSDYEDSSVRNLIGMANRYSVCKSIEAFKRLGLQVYDCGGVTLQKENIKMCNIDRYKMEFSNNVITEYNFCYGNTIKGKIMLRIYYLVQGLNNH
jgi:hypothetical protein